MQLAFLSLLLAAVVGCGLSRAGSLSYAEEALGADDCGKVLEGAQTASTTGTPSEDELAQIAFLRAKCAERAGDPADARGLYEFILTKWPDTQWGYRARSTLRALGGDPDNLPGEGERIRFSFGALYPYPRTHR